MAEGPPADAGAGFVHLHRVRIYYEDTDSSGLVYHANYLRSAERARTEMLREFGFVHPALLAGDGVAFVVRHLAADFRAPARLDDLVAVETRVKSQHGASLDLLQDITRDGIDLVQLKVKLACITPDGRPTRVPAALRAAFGRLIDNSSGRSDG